MGRTSGFIGTVLLMAACGGAGSSADEPGAGEEPSQVNRVSARIFLNESGTSTASWSLLVSSEALTCDDPEPDWKPAYCERSAWIYQIRSGTPLSQQQGRSIEPRNTEGQNSSQTLWGDLFDFGPGEGPDVCLIGLTTAIGELDLSTVTEDKVTGILKPSDRLEIPFSAVVCDER